MPFGREHHGTEEGDQEFYLSFTDEEVFRGVDLPKKEERSHGSMPPPTGSLLLPIFLAPPKSLR